MVAVALQQRNTISASHARGLTLALERWLWWFAQYETSRAMREPYVYAGISPRVRKQKDPDPQLEAFKLELRRLLLIFGLREAKDSSSRAAGRELIPESLIRQATEEKPVKIKWFWEMQQGIIQRVEDITDETRNSARESVKRIILDSQDEEVQPSVGEIARRIRSRFLVDDRSQHWSVEREQRVHAREGGREFVFSSERAAIIARTELSQAQNTGIYNGYKETGVEELEWLAYSDGRSGNRHHERMNGKRVKVGEYFTTPLGNKLRYPGDPSAPIVDSISCRCTSIPIVDRRGGVKQPKIPALPPEDPIPSPHPVVSSGNQTVDFQGSPLTFTRDRSSKTNGYKLVRVRVDDFDRAWSRNTDLYIQPGGRGEIAGRREGFQRFMQKGEPIEASRINYNSRTGVIDFGDGRHRFSVLRDLGLKEIPVAVDPSQIEDVLRAFGVKIE